MDKINEMDALAFYGGAVKAKGIENGKGTLCGYGVVFSTPGKNAQKDLSGQYFTKSTYFGPRDGDGADGAFHHCLPVKGISQFSDELLGTCKTTKDDTGIFTEIVLDMADKYQAALYKMGEAGKLGFSSGTAAHMIKCEPDGEIKRWPIVEISLTPTPCEPRARASAMKALEVVSEGEAMTAFVGEFKAIFDSQEEAEEAFMDSNDRLSEQYDENWRLGQLAALQMDAILLQADIMRLALAR